MRIISQDGMIDVPYEQMIIYINYINKNQIMAQGVHLDEEKNICSIARYSTEYKAKRAMEMLRQAYTGIPFVMKSVELSEKNMEAFKNLNKTCLLHCEDNEYPRIQHINNGYFQFPVDEDVEV